MRPSFARAAALLTFALVLPCLGAAVPTRHARACSIVGFASPHLATFLDQSPVVAIGTFEAASPNVITLRVEESLRGTTAGALLKVDNREPGLGADCSVYPGNARGSRFSSGARVVALLEPAPEGTAADWRPIYFGLAVFEYEGEDAPLRPWGTSAQFGTRADMPLLTLKKLVTAVDIVPDPRIELTPPCNNAGPFDPGHPEGWLKLATVVVAGTYGVPDARGAARFHVEDVYRGKLTSAELAALTVNTREMYHLDNKSCDLTPVGAIRSREGERAVLFLRPDETGIAQYRPANYGLGVLRIEGNSVTWGAVTVAKIRQAIVAVEAPRPDEREDHEQRWPVVLTAVASLALAGATLALARTIRLRRGSRR